MRPLSPSRSRAVRTSRTVTSRAGDLAHELVWRTQLLGCVHQLVVAEGAEASNVRGNRPNVADCLDHVASTCLTLGADHRRAFADAPQRFAQVTRTAHERDFEGV